MTAEQRQELVRLLPAPMAGGLTAYGEARNQPIAGIQGVLSVQKTRVSLGKWGATWASVVLADRQFSCWNDHDPNSDMLLDLAHKLINHTFEPSSNPILDACIFVATRVMNGDYQSNVGRAMHYFNPKVVTPAWATEAPAHQVAHIYDHVFYEGVRV